MGIFYIDPQSGSDAAAGTSWALAWKTMRLGATAARIAPNDEIRIAKSPDPVPIGNATWTNFSKTVTLAASLTANVEQCETAWTPTANVTATIPATGKQGTNNVTLSVASGFTTGKVGFKAIPLTNFSGYQQLSFWFRSSVLQAEGALKVCLCSDTNGDVIVDTFLIPKIDTTKIAAWNSYCLNKGSALGSAIQSVAVYAVTDPGTTILMIDNIIAVKAIGSNDALSLTSLISKNPLATGGAECWYPIQSITDNVILLDNHPANTAALGRGYYGTTETVATYRREPFGTEVATDCTIQDSGTDGNLIRFKGGYNKVSTLQDGETYFDMGCGLGNGIDFTNIGYVSTDRLNMVRANNGMTFAGITCVGCSATGHTLAGNTNMGASFSACSGLVFDFVGAINNGAGGLYLATVGLVNCDIRADFVNNNLGPGVWLAATVVNNNLEHLQVCNNVGPGITIIACNENTIKAGDVKYNTTYGVSFLTNSQRNYVEAVTFGNVTAAFLSDTMCRNYFRNSTFGEVVKAGTFTAWLNSKVYSSYEGGNPSNNYVYMEGGYVRSQAAVRHTESGIAWQLSPTAAARSINFPIDVSLAKIAVNAGSLVTISIWARRDNVGIGGALICRRWQLPGQNPARAEITAAQDEWAQLSVSFTPTIAGVVEVFMEAYGGTMYNVYVDDLSYLQA